MIKKIGWFFLYLCTLLVGIGLGAILPQLFTPEMAGFEKITRNDSVGKIYKDIAYDTGEYNKLDLYIPTNKGPNASKLIVYIHAGGFTAGDKSDDATILENFASKGYVTAGVNYTVRSIKNPLASVYQMSREIQKSIPVIKQEAEKLGYPLDQMAIAGGSAGGNLALIFAYRDASTSPIPVKLVFEMVGPASFEPSAWFGFDDNYTGGVQTEVAASFLSVIVDETLTPEMMQDKSYKEILKKVSPYALVDEKSPPTLTAYGFYDKVAPYKATEGYLFPALEKYNIPHENILFPKSGHGLNRDPEQAKLLGAKIQEYLDKYLK